MDFGYEIEKFYIPWDDMIKGARFLILKESKTMRLLEKDKILMTDLKQGFAGNCALIACLAALSRRPEFITQIVPKVVRLRDVTKYQFNMYHKGRPIKVIIDDVLPFDKKNRLLYAGSLRNIKFFLASLLEK